MELNLSYDKARALCLEHCGQTKEEIIPLCKAYDRYLWGDITAAVSLPPFDRSPFDGYAFRSADCISASPETPVTLTVIEEIPAGAFPSKEITPGTAAKILTGAPVPAGSDAVVKYEDTSYTWESVTISSPAEPRKNIVAAGEDIKAGEIIAFRGSLVTPPLAAVLAGQGYSNVSVFRRPVIGIISTGSEIVEADKPISGGFIRDTNRYSLEGACLKAGALPVYLGMARDDTDAIYRLMEQGLESCDMIISTGGVSAGDYDYTPAAMVKTGAEVLVRNLDVRPGGACILGRREEKLIFCLSGNPASSMTCFYAAVLPCILKQSGSRRFMPAAVKAVLSEDFKKNSLRTRIVRGKIDLTDGVLKICVYPGQGNGVLNSLIDCDIMGIIPAGSPALSAGTVIDAFLI